MGELREELLLFSLQRQTLFLHDGGGPLRLAVSCAHESVELREGGLSTSSCVWLERSGYLGVNKQLACTAEVSVD